MNGKKSRAFRRKDKNRAKPEDMVIIARAYKAAIERSKTAAKPLKQRIHKPARGHSPTWPGSEDQFNQGRPMIVMRPVRALAAALMQSVEPDERGVRTPLPHHVVMVRSALRLPKHRIDAMAMKDYS